MLSQVRKEEILESLENEEVVYLKDLSRRLGVSVSTVRRDVLKMMDEDGIEMLRGGAVRLQKRRLDLPSEKNRLVHADSKEIIAQKAAALVQDGDVIYIDAGTTTSAMYKYLKGKTAVVVTPSVSILRQPSISGISLILIGGEVNGELETINGSLAEKQLCSMYFDKAFLSISGYTGNGVFANDIREARKKEIVKERSYLTYAMADSSKLRRWGFIKVMDTDECTLITESDDSKANAVNEDSAAIPTPEKSFND